MKKYLLLLTICFLVISVTRAKENVPFHQKRTAPQILKLEAGCDPASASANLDINNVRARIMNGGDMWWDLVGTAAYEIPKTTTEGESKKTSLFAGALWIGGYDDGNNLREAAMTYRQSGSDFFPGPLDPNTGSIEPSECIKWDKIFQVTRTEINDFLENKVISDNIENWPKSLAPFIDADGDQQYIPENGDYPDALGDQTLWFVYNDKGNTHMETEALAIGLEVQTMAFAFATNDEINNMTFYKQKIINRSKNKLKDVYFGQWVDADLGYAYDDYVGCDTTRSLGICYNGDDFDEGVMGYGSNPPSVGIDFFQGPKADPNDGVDNDKDGTTDEPEGEEIIMSKFVYYNNDFQNNGNPFEAIHYYNYLDGKWHNGRSMYYGGDGQYNIWESKVVNYMFPDDPRKPYPAWSEVTAKNTPGDRRFLQSAGKFTLKPGAVNYITVGAVWARATTGGNTGSYDLLLIADDKAQKLYNNDFKLIDGPDAPDIAIQELDKELILSLENTTKIEKYYDSTLSSTSSYIKYKFQGYQIYQLASSSVTPAELDNADKARLIARVDIVDGIKQLVNRSYVPGLGIVPVEKVDDGGGDLGIKHTFSVKTDAFSSGDASLINNKQYYYMVLSYSNASDPNEYEQYLAGRKNIEVYTATPHKTNIEFNGNELMSEYGDGPEITRIEGSGNGGMTLELTDSCIKSILEITGGDYKGVKPVYKAGNGPVHIYVYDPLKVPNADFELRFIDSSLMASPSNYTKITNKAYWTLTKLTPPVTTIVSQTLLGTPNEQIFPDWGLAVKADQVTGPSSTTVTLKNGFIEANLVFTDVSKQWLTAIPDSDPGANKDIAWPYNWIRSGKYQKSASTMDYGCDDAYEEGSNPPNWLDPNSVYEKMLNGTIAPYALAARDVVQSSRYPTFGPAFSNSKYYNNPIEEISSIDLVLTPDKTKWTKCLVLEMCQDKTLSEGNASKFFPRAHKSWTGQINNGEPVYDATETGRSYFPGYAVNVETGERLNIIFGEDTYFEKENGRDMLWNPTYNYINPAAQDFETDRYIWGGKHFIYVMGSRGSGTASSYASAYDGGESYLKFFTDNPNPSNPKMASFFSSAMYVMMPLVAYPYTMKSLADGLVPGEVKIRIRIEKPYSIYKTNGTALNNYQPYYTFSTNSIAMKQSTELGKNAMDLVGIVPNPYYAYSEYEKTQLDNRVRFINLPKKCEISIYTLSGTLIRKFKKDESDENHQTYLDWDMKNSAGVPVASGLYIIYVNGYELGTKTLKWFGIMRPLDLDTF